MRDLKSIGEVSSPTWKSESEAENLYGKNTLRQGYTDGRR